MMNREIPQPTEQTGIDQQVTPFMHVEPIKSPTIGVTNGVFMAVNVELTDAMRANIADKINNIYSHRS